LRILLDECVPRGLKRSFRPLGLVLTVPDAGLAGYKNGQLLKRVVGQSDVFITVDKSIEFQQHLGRTTSPSFFCEHKPTTSSISSLLSQS
jgi:hypothetical protein